MLSEKLKANPAIASALQQYQALPDRDRLALKVLAAALCVVMLYFVLWLPAQNFKNESLSQLESARDLQGLVQANQATLGQLGGSAGNAAPALDGQQLVGAVTNMARQQGVALKRFEPSGNDSVKVWLEQVPFDKAARWLALLNKKLGISVKQITLEADDKPGIINARMTLGS